MKSKTLTLTIILAALAAGPAFAEKKWAKEHPRRAQVNKRLKNQDRRVREGVKDGTLTKEQARELHAEGKKIREEERAMAAKHHGHITKKEQRRLNKEENALSKKIYDEKHAAPATAPAGQ